MGYTRGHFCALVPPEPDPGCGGGAGGGAAPPSSNNPQCCYLPLVSRDLAPLPLHFLSRSELGREEELLKQWLDVGLTESGQSYVQCYAAEIMHSIFGSGSTFFPYFGSGFSSISSPILPL